MEFSFKRIFSTLTMFAFIMAASYQSLCAADIIHCEPCEEEGHYNKAEDNCLTCDQSTDVATAVGLHKISNSYVQIDYSIVSELVFVSPETTTQKAQAPPPVLAQAPTKYIISARPIRGPSVVA